MKQALILAVLTIAAIVTAASSTAAQRDYLTDEEIELVRDAQQIDNRIGVLTTAIDRRFEALKLDVGAAKPAKNKKKDSDNEKWGELRTGTRHELLLDIKRIMQKAIDEIDNLAERPDSLVLDTDDKKPKRYEDLFPKAVRALADAAKRYGPVLKAELDKNNAPAEQGSILDSLEMCDQIIASVSRLPAEVKKNKK